MIEHVGLVIAQIADWIFSEVRVIEGKDLEVGESIEVEDFFEAADLVACDVQI